MAGRRIKSGLLCFGEDEVALSFQLSISWTRAESVPKTE